MISTAAYRYAHFIVRTKPSRRTGKKRIGRTTPFSEASQHGGTAAVDGSPHPHRKRCTIPIARCGPLRRCLATVWPPAGVAADRTLVLAPCAAPSLRPSHGGTAFGARRVWRVRRLGLVAVAPARHHLCAPVAIWGKNTVKSGEVHSGLGHQGGQSGDAIQWLKEDMRGAVPVRGLELVLHLNLRLNPVFRNMPGLSAPGRQSGHDLRIQT
jgi:hypothetical protein